MTKVSHTPIDATPQDEKNLLHRINLLLTSDSALTLNDGSGQALELPQQVRAAFQQVVTYIEHDQHVEVTGYPQELTPGQAADFLRIPRAQVLQLIHDGILPLHSNGGRRRIRLQDAIDYQHAEAERVHQGIVEIARMTQEAGAYH